MAFDLAQWHADKKARLARGEAKILTSVAAVKNAFEEKVAELVASTEAAAAEQPKIMPQNTPPATQWSSVDVTRVDV